METEPNPVEQSEIDELAARANRVVKRRDVIVGTGKVLVLPALLSLGISREAMGMSGSGGGLGGPGGGDPGPGSGGGGSGGGYGG